MNINLVNPRTFLPLLLFVGFVFALIGLSFWHFAADPAIYATGIFTIFVAVVLWILVNRGRIGF